MTLWLFVLLAILTVVLIFLATALFGAPFVPSGEREAINAFKNLEPLTKSDVLVDFGCGDGVILRAAVKSGAGKAVGIELNPILAAVARMRSRGDKRVQVCCDNMLTMRLPENMTVVYVFGLDRVMRMIKPRLEQFAREKKRTIYVISKAFEFEGVKAMRENGGFYLYKIG
jgi:predicted RNA methylase